MTTLAVKNQNPGNLKDPKTGAFRQFSSSQEGLQALKDDLNIKISGKSKTGVRSDSSLSHFASVYAPASDKNDPIRYAQNLSKQLGVPPETPISSLAPRLDEFAHAIAQNEDATMARSLKRPNEQPLASAQTGTPDREKLMANIDAMEQQGASQQEVQSYLDSFKTSQQSIGHSSGYPTPPEVKPFESANKESTEPKKDKSLGRKAAEFLFPILEDKERTGLQTAGDLAMSALTVIPGAGLVGLGVKGAKVASLAAKGVKTSKGASAVSKGVKGAISAKNVAIGAGSGYAYDVSSSLSQGKTKAGEVLTPGIGTILGGATGGFVRKSPTAQFNKIVDDLAPELTKGKGIATIAKGGTTKSGMKGLISSNVAPSTKTIAQTVQKHIPEFANLKTFSEKLNATKSAITRLAEDLKTQVIKNGEDIIYPFKELNKRLTNLKKPIEIRADPVQARKFDLARQAAMRIAKAEGGKISKLFDARKKFDDLVEKEFPNLYDRANAPMRSAITSIRREMNDFIEEQLSKKGVKYKESLKAQSELFGAVDNLAPKAWGEVGTTALGRTMAKHPLIRNALIGGASALLPAGIAGYIGAKMGQ